MQSTPTRLNLSLTLLCLLLSAPSARAEAPQRVVLLPMVCAGMETKACQALETRLAGLLRQRFGLEVLAGSRVEKAVAARCEERKAWSACLEQDANLFAVGRVLDAPAALSLRLASLGERQTVKMRWVDVGERSISVETVEAATGELSAWASALDLLLSRVYPPPPPAPAWYERWQVWTAVGAGAVLITGVVLAVTLAPGSDDPADYHLQLP